MPPRKATDAVLRRFVAVLPCALKPDELRDRGGQLARAREKFEQHEAESKTVREELKKRENEIDAEMGALARIIRDGTEAREVAVEVRVTAKSGHVDEVRVDTGEVLQTRKASDEELQPSLPGLDADALTRASGGAEA